MSCQKLMTRLRACSEATIDGAWMYPFSFSLRCSCISLLAGIVWLFQKFSNGALSLSELCGCSENSPMVLSHSWKNVAAPKIFQWCSLTFGIMWLLRKFFTGALSLPESCGCSRNFPMVLSHSQNHVVTPVLQIVPLFPRCSCLNFLSLSNGASFVSDE